MGDTFYRVVRFCWAHPFRLSGSPVVAGLENIPMSGPAIIASNHTSPFDVPLLILHVPRPVDFVSVVEVFRNPLVGWFYGSMNAFPLDRSKPDAPTVRTILNRLENGRLIGMFPEGGFRRGDSSVIRGGRMRSGVGRLAVLANAPVVPAVVMNSSAYARPGAWMPLRRTRYALAFGAALSPRLEADEIERRLAAAFVTLHQGLVSRLPEGCRTL